MLSLSILPAARAQWAACRADGTLLQPGDPGYNQNGSATLFGSSLTPDVNNTYPSPLSDWQSYPYFPLFSLPTTNLNVSCTAVNYYIDPSYHSRGVYNPGQYERGESSNYVGTPVPLVVGSVTNNVSGVLNAYFKYVGSGSAPDHANFLVASSVSASVNGYLGNNSAQQSSMLTGTATASLGQDTVTAALPGQSYVQQSHRRLVHTQVSGGIATVTLSGQAEATADNHVDASADALMPYFIWTDDMGASASASASGSANAYPDSRGVSISSSLEPTFHKDAATGQRTQNQRSSSGFMNADTVAPLPPEPVPGENGYTLQESKSVTYSPIIDNSQWGRNSSYTWTTTNSSLDEPSGTFNAFWPNINVSSPVAKYSNPPITPGQSDYITLKVTDGNDGAEATANYSMQFHGYYEQWQRTATQNHPGSFTLADGTVNPEWTYVATNDCPGPAAGKITMGQTYTASVTQTGSIGDQLSLSAPGILAFQANESINIGETCTGTISASYEFAGAPYTRTEY